MSVNELMYKKKYLKYKAKYTELKSIEQQGGLLESGFSVVFTSTENASKLREAFEKGAIGSKGSIADLLDKQAYIIFDGKKPAELMESNKRIMKEQIAAATAVVKSATNTAMIAASNAASIAASTASSAASSASNAASSATKSIADQYTKYQQSQQKAALEKSKSPQSVENSLVSPVKEEDLVGGSNLPKTIKTLDNKTFDRANEAHKKFLINAVAVALNLDPSNITMVIVKFKMFGKPELRD